MDQQHCALFCLSGTLHLFRAKRIMKIPSHFYYEALSMLLQTQFSTS